LGQGEPLLISASHGDGLADVAQELIRCAQVNDLRLLDNMSSAGERSRYFSGGRKERSHRHLSTSKNNPNGSDGSP
jgi:predicted GTPase